MPTAPVSPRDEAARLLELHGGSDGLDRSIGHVEKQFEVIQARSQLLLTLGTLTLTITGFSGPAMARSGTVARWGMAAGLALCLAAMVVLLIGSLRIRWVTQMLDAAPLDALTGMIEHRNRRTRIFQVALVLVVAGLACYVSAVASYLLTGFER